MFFLLAHEVPLLVELNLFRFRRSVLLQFGRPARREGLRHVLRRVVYNDHRLQMHLLQGACFPHPITFDDVFEDGNNSFLGQPRIEKNCAAMFGKLFLQIKQ